MKLGVWTPLPHTIRVEPRMERAIADLATPGAGAGEDLSHRFAVDVVRKAEAYGFQTTLIAERFLGPDLEAWILSAALAGETSSIELMVAVHPGIVAPQVVAKMGASLDRISGGRFAVNIVNGWWQEEFDLFGNGGWIDDPAPRYRRMDEFIQVIQGLWTEERYSLDGAFYRVDGGSLPIKPVQRPHPPIYAASRSDPGREVIARRGDVWFVAYAPDYRLADQNMADMARDVAAMETLSQSHGRRLSYGISAHVICAESKAEAESQAADLQLYGEKDRVAAVAAKALGPGLFGTPREIADRIDRYREIGIDCFMLHFHPMIEGLDLFAAEVMPLLRP